MTVRVAPLVALLLTPPALARPHLRRHFEPTDLELELPGTVQLDLEVGLVRSQDPWRLVVPDFDLDVGLATWLELGLNGGYALEGAPGESFSLDHSTSDPLWASAKVGLLDLVDEEASRSYALGLQAGPKLPTFPGGHGVGVEGLLLGGVGLGATTLSVNVGGFVDPAQAGSNQRPIAFESGITWDQDLDHAGHYSISTDLSGVVFAHHEPAELELAVGPVVEVASWLDLSFTAVLGLLPSGDRYGALFGFSPHLQVWHPASH